MNRNEQYKGKLELINEKITHLPTDSSDSSEKVFPDDTLSNRLLVSIDAIMELIAMLCEDQGIMVKDVYSNLDELVKKGLLPPEMAKDIRQLNATRYLTRRYDKIGEDVIMNEKENIFSFLKEFVKKLESIIKENYKET
jgi:uncharacterized protein YutE (UPF0331/DUF86 family)